jgi:hypothetical protein
MLPLAMIYDAVDPYMSVITMFLISFCLLGFELLLVAELNPWSGSRNHVLWSIPFKHIKRKLAFNM